MIGAVVTCTPPSVAGAIGLTAMVAVFAATLAGVAGAGVADCVNSRVRGVVAAGISVGLVALAITIAVGAFMYRGALTDYHRCEQRVRVTVGGAK